jgi:hypothetical protein
MLGMAATIAAALSPTSLAVLETWQKLHENQKEKCTKLTTATFVMTNEFLSSGSET